MWHFEFQCQRIRALVKVNHKPLNVVLASKIKKLNLVFFALNLDKFLCLTVFFSNLADFWLFKFLYFLAGLPPTNLTTMLLPLFFL